MVLLLFSFNNFVEGTVSKSLDLAHTSKKLEILEIYLHQFFGFSANLFAKNAEPFKFALCLLNRQHCQFSPNYVQILLKS